MARLLLIVPLLVVAVIAIVFAVRELGQTAEVTEGTQPGPAVDTSRTVRVRIRDDRFRPANVSLSAGQTVRWVNADDGPHTVRSAPSSSFRFNSGPIPPGEVYQETFEDVGVFPYRGDARGKRGEVTVLTD